MKSLLAAYLLLLSALIQAQPADSAWAPMASSRHVELCLLTGYAQGRCGFGELGISANVWGSAHHPFGAAAYVATELRLDRTELIGPKIGMFLTGGFAMGAQAIYYTDGSEGALVFRPEYGLGLFKFKLTYGYNLRITNKDMPGLNSHLLNATYCFRLKRLRGDDARR
ncbi:MAG: hypothetical protein IPL52_14210 [Flavobacteriales bacterium]|nr:hypothetical protein [Flavobacteriales bacterium]